jgi:Leucine-rich repeat (LRR) protein
MLSAFWNNIVALPDFSSLTALTNLNLSDNKLESWPTGFQGLARLEECNISKNLIASIPDEPELFASLRALVELTVSKNRITTLPAAIACAPKLEKVMASANPFDGGVVPAALLKVAALRVVDISECGLAELPAGGWSWNKLEIVLANGNNFASVPSKWATIGTLIRFSVRANTVADIAGLAAIGGVCSSNGGKVITD